MSALVVNLYGGPGTSKSTNAAMIFGLLKQRGIVAELAPEFAKDLVWEERNRTIMCQPYIFAKQMWRVERLREKVDVIVTDSPILLSTVYGRGLGENFIRFVTEIHESWKTMDIFLVRNTEIHPYSERGRFQDEEGARALDLDIEQMLVRQRVPFRRVAVAEDTADYIANLVQNQVR